MSLSDWKSVLPDSAVAVARRWRMRMRKARVNAMPALTEEAFQKILTQQLGLIAGDNVIIHSSMDALHLSFSFGKILSLVRGTIGEKGTMLFPTFPKLSSYEFLRSGEIFDVRKTPSYMGILTEFARRQREAVRSLHPTKSVCAIGPLARVLTATHSESPYAFDRCSPYYKLAEHGGKIIGLGVSTERNSFVHCVEDVLKDDFPVRVHHPDLFAARCLNYNNEIVVVETFAHDLKKMNHNIPRFMDEHITGDAVLDLKIDGMKFFQADAAKLLDQMTSLAARGITIYPPRVGATEPLQASGQNKPAGN
jgi:aminoglycoside 3-N-acetyltransferase